MTAPTIGRMLAASMTAMSVLGLAVGVTCWPGRSAMGAEYYLQPARGSDTNEGSIDRPWQSLAAGIPRLRPGDTLYLRSGSYFESDIRISVRGTEAQRILIRNHPDETATVDGGYREFRKAPNADWEIVDGEKHVYRSVKPYPVGGIVHAYLGPDDGDYHLVPYERLQDLSAENEDFTGQGPMYVGPGVLWNEDDGRIYVRLQPSRQELAMGHNVPKNPDPRQTPLFVVLDGAVLVFEDGASYLDLEGLRIRGRNHALHFLAGSHHISVRGCDVLGGRTHIIAREGVHHLLFDGITVDDSVPPWIAWTDVKSGTQPAHRLQQSTINLQAGTHDVEVRNCVFRNVFDNFNGGPVHNLRIHHNTFLGTRDDVFQMSSASYDVEIDHNLMFRVSKGPSWHGGGTPPKPGTIYVHHNIIDTTQAMLVGRPDPRGLPKKRHGMQRVRPIGSHQGSGFGEGAPWTIYNNTLLFGRDLNGLGAGHCYRIAEFHPEHRHEVYNNIFVQIEDHWVAARARTADGSQVHDGNLYWRTLADPKQPLISRWAGKDGPLDFATLAAFKASPSFQETKSYYPPGWESSGVEADPGLDAELHPAPDGPAAQGAVPLPAHWPGRDGGAYRGALPPRTSRTGGPEHSVGAPGASAVLRKAAG